MQLDALKAAGCDVVYSEKISAIAPRRPQLAAALDDLKEGDTLLIWRLDRLGRSVAHLIDLINELRDRGIQIASITEGFDTNTALGTMLFHVIAALAEMERSVVAERVKTGLDAARRNGRTLGRPPKVTARMLATAERMREDGESWTDIGNLLGVNRSTVQKAVAARQAAKAKKSPQTVENI